MTLQDAEQDAGVRLEKTDEYTRHRDAMKAQGFAVVHGFRADAMRDELLAEVVRLAGELEHANKLCIRDLEHTEQRAEDAEADLATMTKERDEYRQDRALLMEATIEGPSLDDLFPGEWPDGAEDYMARLAQWMVEHGHDNGTPDAQAALARYQPTDHPAGPRPRRHRNDR